MSTLPNYPFVNQLDGTENANMNCVPASTASAIRYLTGMWVTPDSLKDAEYGPGYTGGTSFAYFHDNNSDLMVNSFGCDGTSYYNETPSALVNQIHNWVDAGYPVIATIPSSWGTVYSLYDRIHGNMYTHVVAFYSSYSGGLTAMNPWGAFAHDGSDSYWSDRLCFAQVWKVYRISADPPDTIAYADADLYWTHTAGTPGIQVYTQFTMPSVGGFIRKIAVRFGGYYTNPSCHLVMWSTSTGNVIAQTAMFNAASFAGTTNLPWYISGESGVPALPSYPYFAGGEHFFVGMFATNDIIADFTAWDTGTSAYNLSSSSNPFNCLTNAVNCGGSVGHINTRIYFIPGGVGWVKRSGVWVRGATKVRRSGAWEPGLVKVRRSSVWTPTS